MVALPPNRPVSAASEKWKARFVRSGYFFGAVLLHLILFFMLATWIIFRAPVQHTDNTVFAPTTVRPPPPPAPPPPAGGGSSAVSDPTVDPTPPPVAPSMIVTSAPQDFSMKSVTLKIPNLPSTVTANGGSELSGTGSEGSGSGPGSEFGSPGGTGSPLLTGYLYDLKQTRNGQPTGYDPGKYEKIVLQFINSGWDPGVLREFYKSPKPLVTPDIFIPIIKAEDGPAAFGVADAVKPNEYVVWYKVRATAPQEGTYRFVGTADDILFVKVNHKTVLDGTDYGVDKELRSQEKSIEMTNFNPTFPNNGKFWVGLPFHVDSGEEVDIDVLIGEQPGGRSDYFLYIQRDDEVLKTQSNGSPLLPIFQVDPKPIKINAEPMTFPPYSDTPEPWTPVAPTSDNGGGW